MGRRRFLSHGDNDSQDGHGNNGPLRWLLTYADMITLLMAFFIMLYSMSIINVSKFKEVAISIRSGFGGFLDGQGKQLLDNSGNIRVAPEISPTDTAGVPYTAVKELKTYINQAKLDKDVSMYTDKRGLIIGVSSDNVLFNSGSADIKPGAEPFLGQIAEIIKSVPNEVRIEGHTCNLPISTERFPSNWELSTSRATNVVRLFTGRFGVPGERLSAAGYADTHPFVPNTTDANRLKNRRVEIVILRNETPPPTAPAITNTTPSSQ